MLIFDPINYLVSSKTGSVQLQPLSFKLLEKLAEAPGEIQSVDSLMAAVWGDIKVSADTLKQRVFVLRKALAESELSDISIQAVRNEGYRLLIAPETQQVTASSEMTASRVIAANNPRFVLFKAGWSRRKAHWGYIPAMLVVLIILGRWWGAPEVITENNRVVLWSQEPVQQMPVVAAKVYEDWRTLLSGKGSSNQIQMIFSELQNEPALPIQARKSRAALISYFDVVQLQDETAVRLSIIEGSTATVLRSDLFSLSDEGYHLILEQHLLGIEALIGSGTLNLQPAQRENAKDPVWQKLSELANQS